MKNLITLVKMQLKEKFNQKKTPLDKSKVFSVATSLLGAALKFAIVTAMCVVLIILVNTLGLFSLTGTIPDTLMSLIFSAMLLLSIFSCTIGLTKAMYFSRDNAILLTLPCKPIQVFLSKLIIFALFEIRKNFAFVVPLFIAYFITHSYAWYFYPWLVVCYLFISILTVAIGALLSVPAMWISNIFRQHRVLQICTIVVIVAVCIFALFFGISLIPPELNLRAKWSEIFWFIQDVLKYYANTFSAMYDLTRLILGETHYYVTSLPLAGTAIRFLVLLGITLLTFVIGILTVQPLFYTMASKPFEYLKKVVKAKKNVRINSKLSPFYNEMVKAFKDSTRMFSNIGIMISIPILIFFLNKMFIAMNTKELGDNMIIAFNLLIILLIALNANTYASSIFSRDGRSAYFIKVQPTNPALLLIAKLIPNTLFCLVSFAITFVILLVSTKLSLLNATYMILSVLFIYLAHLMFCAQTDLMNPQTEIYASVGEQENNPNESISTVTAFAVAFLVAIVAFLLLIENASPVFPKLFYVGFALFVYETWLFFSKIKLYYKEK